MSQKIPVVAIVGRTNVGKSTLFNALAGRRIAVVEDTPGVTRDRNYHLVRRYDFPFTIIDTGGLLGDEEVELQKSVRQQAELAIAEADVVLAVFDGKYGPHPFDAEVVSALRRSGKTVLWVVNKCEKKAWAQQANEFYRYGLDDLEIVSAANNQGIKELVAKIGALTKASSLKEAITLKEESREDCIRVAIVGRPNVGKSTLINKLIGEERLIASPIPGTTRDSVDIEFLREGQRYTLVDTAGLRKKSRVDAETAERYANLRSLSALANCDVAVLLIDAEEGMPTDQDIRIATLIHERGRAFVIAINKWDAIEKDNKTAKEYEEVVREAFNFAKYAPILYISAKTGKRCPTLFDTVKLVHESAQLVITKEDFQAVLWEAVKRNLPPVYHGRPIKFVGAQQIGSNPPTFEILASHPPGLTDTYVRYLKARLREKFPFPGSDMRLVFKKKTRKASDREADEAARNSIRAGETPDMFVQEWDL